jgi:hypothetical protein
MGISASEITMATYNTVILYQNNLILYNFYFFSGMLAYDLICILKIFKKERWLTSDEYNNRLRHEI